MQPPLFQLNSGTTHYISHTISVQEELLIAITMAHYQTAIKKQVSCLSHILLFLNA